MILAAALSATESDRGWILSPDGRTFLAGTARASKEETERCFEEARRVLANQAARTAPPAVPGGKRARIETDDSIPLEVVAKVLPYGDEVRAILVVARKRAIRARGPDERREPGAGPTRIPAERTTWSGQPGRRPDATPG